jgi:peptidoglycan/xylan/chitin deacetylase (PgdA/CDA1 family)
LDLSRRLRQGVDTLLDRSPVQPFLLWRASKRLTVLAYHGLVDAESFSLQLEYLGQAMTPVSIAEVVDAMTAERPLPPRAVLVTFDDGDRSIYDIALPVMRSHGVPGVVFVVAGLLGTDEPFWWEEVDQLVSRGGLAPGLVEGDPAASVSALKRVPDLERRAAIDALRRSTPGPAYRQPQLQPSELLELERAGIAIGNHTFSHPCLDRCEDDALVGEVERAHRRLTEILGKPPVSFAYPNGNVDARVPPILARLGYEVAFLFDHKVSPFPPPDRYRVSRVRVSSSASADRFRILVSGLHSTVHRLIGRQ